MNRFTKHIISLTALFLCLAVHAQQVDSLAIEVDSLAVDSLATDTAMLLQPEQIMENLPEVEYTSGSRQSYEIAGITVSGADNYEDFVITCPNCGERINDEMILHSYDENVLSGYNILCNRKDCGCQTANVKYIGK